MNLFEIANWPSAGPAPIAELLHNARGFAAQLAPADTRFVSIIGTGQRTVTGVERQEQEFVYEISSAGDGTVAIDSARLASAQTYSVRCEHSELPRSPTVAQALIDLLRSGRTRRLSAGVTERAGRRIYLTDARISRELYRKLDWHKLSVPQRRRYLDRLSAAPAAYRPGSHRAADTDAVQKL